MNLSTRRPSTRDDLAADLERSHLNVDGCPWATATQPRHLLIAVDPSEDELARDWNLSSADLAVIAECRSGDHRRRFALQLCVMRRHGCFWDDYRRVPVKIVNHLSRQLGLAPVLLLDRPGRAQTERE